MVDSNVLIDFLDESRWTDWSRAALARAQGRGRLVVNAVVRAETAGRFTSAEEQSEYLADLAIETIPIDVESAFRAGGAFRTYRQRGGQRETLIADFLIGGHAVGLEADLLTRDRQRFATYFPELTLITPETEHG